MTAAELKMAAWEMDATASALAAHIEIARHCNTQSRVEVLVLSGVCEKAADEAASLQAYAHVLQAEAAKEGAA